MHCISTRTVLATEIPAVNLVTQRLWNTLSIYSVMWDGITRVQVVTDSRYVKDHVFLAREWKKNGWRNRHGEPRENSDLWKQLLSAMAKTGIRVDFEWTPGKKTDILRKVDKAAKAAAKRGGVDIDRGFKHGNISRSMVKGTTATRFPAQGQLVVVRPYRKNAMGKDEDKIRFDVFSEETQRYTESCYAFATPAVTADLHRQHLYRVRFNGNPQYPQIVELIEEYLRREEKL